jgi:uncharacterized membrane protein
MEKNLNKKPLNRSKKNSTLIAFVSVLAMIAVAFSFFNNDNSEKDKGGKATDTQAVVKDADIVIPISDITETATFFPAEIDGTKLEVLAVKAPDGSIRTAFNTCQVCYSSGRGYYVQEGDVLVCQNCGNRFGMDDVEVVKGGCNPVPIAAENKTVDAETITVSKDFLKEATVIFKNWK